MFQTELFPAELALERLESSVYSVDVSFEVLWLSKLFPTFNTLVKLEFLVNQLNVSVQVSCVSK